MHSQSETLRNIAEINTWSLKVICINLIVAQSLWKRVWISITANLAGFDEHFGLTIETLDNPNLRETHHRAQRCIFVGDKLRNSLSFHWWVNKV